VKMRNIRSHDYGTMFVVYFLQDLGGLVFVLVTARCTARTLG